METGLHTSYSLANSPCSGVCSTSMAPFDERCKGCGRTVEEIRDWETFPEFQKKLINVKNWLENYDIRQKIEVPVNMSNSDTLKDINGRMITTIALIEMIAQDMLLEFGKDEVIKDAYQALFESRKEILKAQQSLPHLK
jgi:predicted Fe-S protein YdhL (DUF1289 family)|tara:strand:+ start:117 stop:533 length:417 start_codon:yes stop_codon:yes gene_type:complete